MTEHEDALQLLDSAERAAATGEFESAHELLQRAVRRQEEDLGPSHPDLVQTLNNLAVVAEKTGRAGEAEPYYRRAVAIAEAAFPPGHPMLVASRQNLQDFCGAHALSVAAPAAVPDLDSLFESEPTSAPAPPTRPDPPASLSPVFEASPAARTSEPRSHSLAVVAGGVVVLVLAAVLVLRPWSSPPELPPAQTAAPPAPQAAEAPAAAASTVAPAANTAATKQAAAPSAASREDDRHLHTRESVGAGGVAVAAQLCRTFSTSTHNWRCDPAGDSVAAGRLVLYTRIKSARDTAVVHRWYREGTLRQSVTLRTRANAVEGYRTYSQQTVSAGAWRVEVRSADGSVLHEQQFVVH